MRIKTIIIILVTAMLTIVLVQNNEPVSFSFLWATFKMSKLVMLAIIGIAAFILGILVGRPSRVKRLGGDDEDDNDEKSRPGTLSDEDRDYIS